jgi:hypothetical protein
MFLSEYLNYLDFTIITEKAFRPGVLGLFDRVSSDLYLNDGVYSFWARDTPDPVETGKAPTNNMYGSHPFIMGRAKFSPYEDEIEAKRKPGWVGVFINNAAAQDFWIKNDFDIGLT